MSTDTRNSGAASLAACLFESGDIVEVRCLPGGRSTWTAACDLHRFVQPEDQNVYFGANPRTRVGGSKARDVAVFRCLFVDIDNTLPQDAAARLQASGLPIPTAAVFSGGGVHYYWRLAEPLSDPQEWKLRQKALIQVLGSDTCIHDPPRIMRLVGTTNLRRGVEAKLLDAASERRHPIDLFPAAPASSSPVERSGSEKVPARARHTLDRAVGSVVSAKEGGRNDALNKAAFAAGRLITEHGLDRSEVVESLRRAALAVGLEAPEVDRTIESGLNAGSGQAPNEQATRDGDGSDGRVSQAEKIVRLALEQYRVGINQAREAFLVANDQPGIAIMFRGSLEIVRSRLAASFRRIHGGVPSASALADAITTLEGEALDSPAETTHLRVAEVPDGIVLDLGSQDGRAVVVTASGWRVEAHAPVLFRRSVLTGELPMPERGGDVEELRGLLNVTEDSWSLVLGWLVSAFMPSCPHAILLLSGEMGTGKTTAARTLTRLFDESPAPIRSAPRNADDWSVAADASWGIVLDNVSEIPDWFSETLCKAVTGDGWIKRTLYTNGGVSVFAFRRVIVLTSIDTGALRGDLGDRLMMVDLEPIDEHSRRTEAELEARFKRLQPRLLGALLDLLAEVLRVLPTVQLSAMPRLADFGRVLAAIDMVRGTRGLGLYMQQRGRIAVEVVDDDPLASALLHRFKGCGEWTGTAGQILEQIHRPDSAKDWPKSPTALGRRLRRITPALRQVGVEFTPPGKHEKRRLYSVRSNAPNAQPPEIPAPVAAEGEAPWAFEGQESVERPGECPWPDPSLESRNGDIGHVGVQGVCGASSEGVEDERGDPDIEAKRGAQ